MLSRKITAKGAEAFIQGKKSLVKVRAKHNGNVQWAQDIPVKGTSRQPDGQAIMPDADGVAFYRCPKATCSKLMPTSTGKFDYQNVDQAVKCMHCESRGPSHLWKCACGQCWFECQRHVRAKVVPFRARVVCARKSGKRKTSATTVTYTHDQLLKQDVGRAKRRKVKINNQHIVCTSKGGERSIVERMASNASFGPNITGLLQRLRANGAPYACYKQNPSSSSS